VAQNGRNLFEGQEFFCFALYFLSSMNLRARENRFGGAVFRGSLFLRKKGRF